MVGFVHMSIALGVAVSSRASQILQELLPDLGVDLPSEYGAAIRAIAFEALALGDASNRSMASGVRVCHLRTFSHLLSLFIKQKKTKKTLHSELSC